MAVEGKNGKGKADLTASAVLAGTFSFLLMVYAPLETYFTNKKEFWFDFYGIIGANLLAFLVLFAVVFGVLFLAAKIHEKCYRFCFSAGSVVLLACYIEGTFLVNDLPMLDGRAVDWGKHIGHRYVSIAVLLVLSIAIFITIIKLGFKKIEHFLKTAFMILSAILFVTMISLGIMNNGFERKERIIINKDHEFDYSTSQNFIILILDSVDGEVFNELLAKHPEYSEDFRDFTYYSNMLSTYTQTAYSVGHILTGEWFEDDKEDYEDYLKRAYEVSPFFAELEQRDFRIGMYITEFVPQKSDRPYTFDNILKGGAIKIDLLNYLKIQTKMVGFRYAPYDLKRFCEVYTRDFMFSQKGIEKDHLYYDLNEDFYEDLKTQQVVETQDKIFKLFHVEGAHVPFRHDAEVNVIDSGSFEMSIEASFTIAEEWIKKLKEAGVYENSTLIIMSDHSYSETDVPEDRQHPVFLVKGVSETGEKLRISEAPVSFEDFGEAFVRLLDGADGQSIFDWKEGDQRDRRCYFLSYPELMKNVECIQHGHAGDMETLEILK